MGISKHDQPRAPNARIKRQNLQKLGGSYRAVRWLSGDPLEVSNALKDPVLIGGGRKVAAGELRWVRSPDKGTVEGRRGAGGLEIGDRSVVGFEQLGSNDLKVSDDVLDRTGDGVGAVRADGNLPLDVRDGVVALETLKGVLCKSRCLRHELVLSFGCVHGLGRSPRGVTHSQGKRYAHEGGDDQADVLHDG